MNQMGDEPSKLEVFQAKLSRTYQHYLDKSAIYTAPRWLSFFGILALYLLRIYVVNGFFLVTYALGIFLLNNLIGFLTPQLDPEADRGDGLGLPTTNNDVDEFRPFERRLPEFQFWYSCIKGLVYCFMMTFFSVFDVPVFWPILLIYFIVLFSLTMKRQIQHMIKYKYVPFSWGKPKHTGKKAKDDT
uniref:Protein RER1 n=1 Tax=Pinguiococcus pyrenoidosus TaxID=172671 RepID=A0A7R9YCX7_9STRA|mmetsp:Transcript_3508/g.13871  ORF Transcript_3508/g.13871 Transcript_3508/m.13871 type:complete len:187 (+) Transcript_3508:92-652(+)